MDSNIYYQIYNNGYTLFLKYIMNKKVSHILLLTMKRRKHTVSYLCGYNAQAIHYSTITIFYT